jgi:hypothetical protein
VRLLILLLLAAPIPLVAQLPFYTDDANVTEVGKVHFEFFNEFDALQREQFPDLRQNTANFKINTGLPFHLELDFDTPHLAIFRALEGPSNSSGIGDTNLGVKWKFHEHRANSRIPALAASLYIEFPTGDESQELGSGLTDYWLNVIGQQTLGDRTRLTCNLGILFAGNTSTGVVGIQTKRGRVYTGGISLLRDFSSRLTLGVEVYGGIASDPGLSRSQLQAMLGGTYAIRKDFSFSFGLLGGEYAASPRIGGQVGFSVDFPAVHSP